MAEIVSGTLGVHAVNITNFEVDPGDLDISAADINDATAVGISLMTATDAAAGRTAIGAGTSSLALGTSGTTALAGNTTASGITATSVPGGSATTVQGILEELEARIADLETPSP